MSKVSFDDKVDLNISQIADVNKVVADDINQLKNGINENTNYTIVSSGTSTGQLKCLLSGTLELNDIFNIFIPLQSENLTTNAKLSIDNETSYYDIVYFDGTNVKLGALSNTQKQLYFDGTNFVLCDSEYIIENDTNWTTKKYSNGYLEMWHKYTGTFTLGGQYGPSTAHWVQTPQYNYPQSVSKVVSIQTSVMISQHLIQTSYFNVSNNGYSMYISDLAQTLTNVQTTFYTYILAMWR